MSFSLAAENRKIRGKAVKQLRTKGMVPAVLYGHGTDGLNLTIDGLSLKETWRAAGSNQLVDLKVGSRQPVKVLIYDIQEHPVDSSLLHADLYQVKMTEKIETEIPLKFSGESLAVKDLEGNLMTEKDNLKVRCLPADLVPEFEVDISVLKTFDDVIKVADIKVPQTIEVLNDPEEIVALVTPPREEEVEAEPVGAEAEAAAIAEMEAKAEAKKAEGEQTQEKIEE